MCGFLGEILKQPTDKDSFIKLLNLSKHRGPDQQGYWATENGQMGFNRLSIIDLSENAKQPLLSPSGRYVLVFNGEIYNYKELQNEFLIQDSELRSNSDSEIICHLLDKITVHEVVTRLNGMFSIAIYDTISQKLFMIRDFAGIKPFYYGISDNGVVFASQFDQIFCHTEFKQAKKLRPEIMKEFFGLGYMHAPNTVFYNIFQVEPAQIITWDFKTQSILEKKYYYEWETSIEHAETDRKTIYKFEIIFSEVIKKQLNADVPIATFLSGGVDSPLVTAFSKKHKNSITAFTFGINNIEYDESDVAKKIAHELNVKQNVETINQSQIIKIIEEHFNFFSEPFGDESSIPTYIITQQAKKYSTVMLSGDGGDELFWGYPRFLKSVQNIHWFYIPLFLRKIIVPFFRRIIKKTSSALDIYNDFDEWIFSKQVHLTTNDIIMPKYNYSKELLASYDYQNGNNKTNALLYLKKNEFYGHLQKVLRKVDLMSMANSMEIRVPFLDKEIIKFSNTINPEYGIKHQTSKYLLRNVLGRYISKDITNLPKKGFSVSIDDWLKNELKDDVLKTLEHENFYGKEFINKQELKKTLTDFFNHKKNVNALGIWHLYAWQKWAKNYNLID